MATQQFDRCWAIYQPARTDDLIEGTDEWIGREIEVQATHVLDHGSPYDGQWAWFPIPPGGPVCAWIPECDLDFGVEG